MRANVNPEAILFTDDWGAYKPLSREFAAHHDEYAWRHNHRHSGQRSMFHALVKEAARQ